MLIPMKTPVALATLLLAGLLSLHAGPRTAAGPRGGRLLGQAAPRAEFVVEKDRTVRLTFYDAQLKPVPVSGQAAAVVAEARNGRARLEFERKDDALVSTGKLPAGDGYLVVVQLQNAPGAKPQNYRFRLELHDCSGCKLAEYACTCAH